MDSILTRNQDEGACDSQQHISKANKEPKDFTAIATL